MALYLSYHLFNHSSNHSDITTRLSTIIQRVKTKEKETILLKVYQIKVRYIKDIK